MKSVKVDLYDFMEKFLVANASDPYKEFDIEFRENAEDWSHRITVVGSEGLTIKYHYVNKEGVFSGENPFTWSIPRGTNEVVRILPKRMRGNLNTLIQVQESGRFG